SVDTERDLPPAGGSPIVALEIHPCGMVQKYHRFVCECLRMGKECEHGEEGSGASLEPVYVTDSESSLSSSSTNQALAHAKHNARPPIITVSRDRTRARHASHAILGSAASSS